MLSLRMRVALPPLQKHQGQLYFTVLLLDMGFYSVPSLQSEIFYKCYIFNIIYI